MPATIDDLIQLVPPPAVPKNIPTSEEWGQYEVELGCAFPSDYKQIIDTYGVGWFAGWIYLAPPHEILERVKGQPRYLELCLSDWDEPYALYPNPSGLLFCGIDDGNSFFTWRTEGSSHSWTLINFPNRPYEGSEAILAYTWLELLVGWFRGEIKNPRRGKGNQWYPTDVKPTKERFFKQR